MSSLLILALVALGVQIIMFFMIRSRKKGMEYPSEIERKYKIRTRADAWKLLNQPDLPDDERNQIEELYNRM
jgi:hypothetical protein